jgi:hypothetical protein
MRILEDHQYRTLATKQLHLRRKRFQRSWLPCFRFERRIASVVRQRQRFGKECTVVGWYETLRQRARQHLLGDRVIAEGASYSPGSTISYSLLPLFTQMLSSVDGTQYDPRPTLERHRETKFAHGSINHPHSHWDTFTGTLIFRAATATASFRPTNGSLLSDSCLIGNSNY